MIKVIIGYKTKENADIAPMLAKLQSHAMTYEGFKGAENLVSNRDPTIVAIVTTWTSIDHWKAWEQSSSRKEIIRQSASALAEELRVGVYRVMSANRWVD